MLKVKVLEGGKAPSRREDSAGYDCFARVSGCINPLSQVKIPLGFSCEFPEAYVGLLRDRSGLGAKGLMVAGGVIDASYRGEWMVMLYNNSKDPFKFEAGDRVVQALFLPIERWPVVVVEELSQSVRGADGFGSTEKSKG